MFNRDTRKLYSFIQIHKKQFRPKYIALGKKAAKYCREINIDYFEMPHPSGMNRKLNDKKFEKQVLSEAYEYIHGYKKASLR